MGEWHILDENIIEFQVNHKIIYCDLLLNIMVKLNFEKWKKSKDGKQFCVLNETEKEKENCG